MNHGRWLGVAVSKPGPMIRGTMINTQRGPGRAGCGGSLFRESEGRLDILRVNIVIKFVQNGDWAQYLCFVSDIRALV